jgi:hypothetical protein
MSQILSVYGTQILPNYSSSTRSLLFKIIIFAGREEERVEEREREREGVGDS